MPGYATVEDVFAAVERASLFFEPPLTVASRRSDGDAPLHVAAIWRDAEAAALLIGAGAEVDAVGDMGYTPLHYAATYGHVETARVLLAAGASPHLRNEFGRTPADYAAASGRPELAGCLFGRPARPAAADPRWLTPTVVAIAAGVYADRAFDRLPVLADALEDAGCDCVDLLAHCRGSGPHVRGCWAVDLLLGMG